MLSLVFCKKSRMPSVGGGAGVCKSCCEFHECLLCCRTYFKFVLFFNLESLHLVSCLFFCFLFLLFRIVLISGRRSFCSIFSVLPYRDSTQVGYVYACMLYSSLGEKLRHQCAQCDLPLSVMNLPRFDVTNSVFDFGGMFYFLFSQKTSLVLCVWGRVCMCACLCVRACACVCMLMSATSPPSAYF